MGRTPTKIPRRIMYTVVNLVKTTQACSDTNGMCSCNVIGTERSSSIVTIGSVPSTSSSELDSHLRRIPRVSYINMLAHI
jgi:hypothetical protein